jgi:hypothetical protein
MGTVFWGGEGVRVLKLTTQLHLVPRLRMSGVIPLPAIYACMAWAGETLSFYFYLSASTAIVLVIPSVCLLGTSSSAVRGLKR